MKLKSLPRYLFLRGGPLEDRYLATTAILEAMPADHVRTRVDLLTPLRDAVSGLFYPDDPLIDITKVLLDPCFLYQTHDTIIFNLTMHLRESFGPAALGEITLHNLQRGPLIGLFDGFIIPDLNVPVDTIPFIREFGSASVGIATTAMGTRWEEKHGPAPRLFPIATWAEILPSLQNA
jgi:hypothetical protein